MTKLRLYFRRIHWPAIVAAIPTIAGMLLDPMMLNIVPEKYSRVLIAVGSVLQMFVKHVWKPRESV